LDSATSIATVLENATHRSRIPVYTSGCVTKNREGKELAEIEGMRGLGVKMLTDDGDTTHDPAVLLRAMQYATEFGMFFASHCEVPELAGPRALNEGVMSYRLHKGLAGVRRGNHHRPRHPAGPGGGRARAHSARIEQARYGNHPRVESARRREGDGRSGPAPPAVHRRAHRRLRHQLQDEPAAAHAGRLRRAARGAHRRRVRYYCHRPRTPHAVRESPGFHQRAQRHHRPRY
nr:hypothetical protein [Tanacetum cinerariifolium]